ncbi:MAG: MarR family transcriptional regulator [Ideonella sp.]|nr:MarR family transcriptional regulator [Ideonella sp.]MCC7459071.1 MarR family transcriptional regulator [Nitrospira sp.]
MPPPPKPCTLYDGRRYEMCDSVGYQLVGLVAQMRREVDRRMAELDLTDAQWKPLWLLKTGRGDTANELARAMDVDAGAVTRMIDRLESKALLERVRSDADRRVVHLRLTPAGDAVAKKVPFVLAAVNNDFLRGFGEAEWKQLRRLLGRMVDNGIALQRSEEHAA